MVNLPSLSNPLPVSLPQECTKALKLFNSFCDPINEFDKIPSYILRKAKGFAFLTVIKAGFVFSARAGTGCVVARLEDGSFSAPSAIGTAGLGAGFQVGAEMTEFIIILNSRAAVASFMSSGSITLGGNLSVAAGPIGRNLEGNGTISSNFKPASFYSYSRTKGLFGGASIEGSVIVERSDANSKAYGFDVKAKELLTGGIEVPRFADQLVETIKRRIDGSAARDEGRGTSKNYEGEGEEEEEEADNGYGSRKNYDDGKISDAQYSFGSQYASGGTESNYNSGDRSGGSGPSSSSMSAKLSGMGGKLAALGSSISGRSRSNTGSSGGRSRSGSNAIQPPSFSSNSRFDQDFGEEYSRDLNSSSNSPIKTRGKRSDSYKSTGGDSNRDNEDSKWSIGNLGKNSNSNSSDRISSKMTKARSGSLGLRNMTDEMTWGVPSNSRESFDSLDERSQSNPSYTGGDHYDDSARISSTSSPFRNASSSKFTSSNTRTPPKGRSRSNTANSSTFNASPFSDDKVASNTTSSISSRPTPQSNKSYSTKPWDSEDEDLIALNKNNTATSPSAASASRPNLFSSPSVKNGEPLDFSQVEVDFTRLREGMVYAPSPSSNSKNGSGNRSRSSTVGKGIGTAVALFDFKGAEVGDLSFKKGEVITILKKDDAEWFTGRLRMEEGLFPRNYVEEM